MQKVLLLAFILTNAAQAAPQEAIALAIADARTLDKDEAYRTRYLDLTHFPEVDRQFYTRVLTLHINLLSREAVLKPMRSVSGNQLYAIDLGNYGIDTKVWEKLIEREPAYHQIKVQVENVPVNGTDAYGRQTVVRYDQKTARRVYHADHLPKGQVEEICGLTQSHTPIVWGDWFFAMTSIEADRGGIGKGYGYYDFLGLKNRNDYFQIIGFDEKDKRAALSEIGAVVMSHNSGVAQNDRMIVRRSAVDGWAWFTLDFFDSNREERNPLAILDRDKGLKHQAERHFGRLPNGLPIMIACNEKGELVETAPDKIGPDHTAKGQDTRIHPAKSCVSCHGTSNFLRDVSDEVRITYTTDKERGYNLLTSPLNEERLKLERIYLRDLKRYLENDRRDYAIAVRDCVNMEVKDAAVEYREAYERYTLTPVTVDMVASGVGVTKEVFLEKLRAYRASDKLVTHVLAPLSVGRPITRVNFEQIYPLLQQVTRGVPQ